LYSVGLPGDGAARWDGAQRLIEEDRKRAIGKSPIAWTGVTMHTSEQLFAFQRDPEREEKDEPDHAECRKEQGDRGPFSAGPPRAGMVPRRGRPPTMKIDQLFAPENFGDPTKLEWVRQEAEYMVKILEADPNFSLAERMKGVLPPENLLCYFRRRERLERARCIIQYLLSFLGHVPSADEVRRDLVDPAEQFRFFVASEVDQLLEPDVRKAVLQDTLASDPRQDGREDRCVERILMINHLLKIMLAKRENEPAAAIAALCGAVEQLARFWFEVHDNDIRRVRRSDIFMFLLAHLVRNRCLPPSGSRGS